MTSQFYLFFFCINLFYILYQIILKFFKQKELYFLKICYQSYRMVKYKVIKKLIANNIFSQFNTYKLRKINV